MAATLPELCLHLILKELERDWKARYTCILINRHWCISAVPELWKDPFSFCLESGQKERYVQLMDSYIKCLSQEFQKSIGLDSTVKAVFNYTSFLRKIWLNDICTTIKVWLDSKILEETVKVSALLEKKTVFMIFKALCENLIINSTCIEGIYLIEHQIINIFELTQAEENLSNITCLSCIIEGDKVGYLPTLLLSASKILTNLKEITIIWINDNTPLDLCVKNMAQLIKNQRRLEDITISCLDSDFPIIWKSVLEHRNVLTNLYLNLIHFNETDPFPLHELSIFSNLQQLEITYCNNFKFSIDEIDLSSSFQKLNKISIIMDEGKEIPLGFIKVLLKQSNEKIKELTLLTLTLSFGDPKTKDILSCCKEYCTKLIELNYSIDIFYINLFLSYLNTLKYLEILSLNYLGYDGEDLLILIGENLPKSIINLTLNFENYLYLNYLLNLFKICKKKEIKFKMLDFSNCSYFNDVHISLLIIYYGNGQLDKLYLGNKKNFTKKSIEDIEYHVGFVKFSDCHVKYQLPDIDYSELY
ncbi:hypothetical protein GLOIN_2v1883720 [Rhizophagus clarus]|nr:hypothetical protein GLOIN_2v1883720 [Rhizophagus clarus]